MDYQTDTGNHQTETVRVGQHDQEVSVFRQVNFFIHNLVGTVDGMDYQMKLAAPWNGFRYRLRQGDHELANAKKKIRMHAFEPDRPLIRHHRAEFELDVQGRAIQLTSEDRFGLIYTLSEGHSECGRLVMRSREAQESGEWQADLQAPDGWSLPLAAFVAWLAREGRAGMGVGRRH